MMNEAVLELQTLLSTLMTTRCKKYYAGEIGIPYKNALPCLIIREGRTRHERASTNTDRYVHEISILVVTDIVKSFNEAGVADQIMKSRQTLRKIMEEADATTRAPKTNTVLGALMKQSSIDGTWYTYNLNPVVNYEIEQPKEFFYVAAEVKLELFTDFVPRAA